MPTVIENNPNVLRGQPVIRRTRVPVARVLALIGLNYSFHDLKKEIPHLDDLTKKDVGDILEYYKNHFAL